MIRVMVVVGPRRRCGETQRDKGSGSKDKVLHGIAPGIGGRWSRLIVSVSSGVSRADKARYVPRTTQRPKVLWQVVDLKLLVIEVRGRPRSLLLRNQSDLHEVKLNTSRTDIIDWEELLARHQ
jgi:hypothetical protein